MIHSELDIYLLITNLLHTRKPLVKRSDNSTRKPKHQQQELRFSVIK
jgi:hypothetical protein